MLAAGLILCAFTLRAATVWREGEDRSARNIPTRLMAASGKSSIEQRSALKQDFTKGRYDVKTFVQAGGTPDEVFAIGRVTTSFDGGKK